MYHYTECGLPNIWLRNGFVVRETPYGKGVAIQDVEGLHKTIGLFLINNKPRLTGAEVRFLRKELDLSQHHLAHVLGVGDTSVRGWENHRTKITRPADRLLRALYREYVCKESKVKDLVDRVADLDRAIRKRLEFEESDSGWKTAAIF